ncbi:hypothetical protein C5E41_02695 [Nocardia nova]|nr:hypothetical protein C5E41_02695 [Nocardia nova]
MLYLRLVCNSSILALSNEVEGDERADLPDVRHSARRYTAACEIESDAADGVREPVARVGSRRLSDPLDLSAIPFSVWRPTGERPAASQLLAREA